MAYSSSTPLTVGNDNAGISSVQWIIALGRAKKPARQTSLSVSHTALKLSASPRLALASALTPNATAWPLTSVRHAFEVPHSSISPATIVNSLAMRSSVTMSAKARSKAAATNSITAASHATPAFAVAS